MRRLLVIFIAVAMTLTLVGCASVKRWSGSTVSIRGIVKKESVGTPVQGVSVTVRGTYTDPTFPIIASFRPLAHGLTDAEGRFSFVVPFYRSYRFTIDSADGHDVLGGRIIDAAIVESGDTVIEIKEPNQAAQTTPGLRPSVSDL